MVCVMRISCRPVGKGIKSVLANAENGEQTEGQ